MLVENQEGGGSVLPPESQDVSAEKDELAALRAQVVKMESEKAASLKQAESEKASLEKRVTEIEKERNLELQSAIDRLVGGYKHCDTKVFEAMSKKEREEHILKEAITFDFDLSKLTLKERKSAIESVVNRVSTATEASGMGGGKSTIAKIMMNPSGKHKL